MCNTKYGFLGTNESDMPRFVAKYEKLEFFDFRIKDEC